MASTLSSTADLHFDGGVAPTVTKDHFTDIDEALARLMDANFTSGAPARAPASDRSVDERIPQSFQAATIGPAGRQRAERRSLGKRGTLARVAIMVCLGASAIWAWRSYGGPAPEQAAAPRAIETSAPPPAQSTSIAPSTTTAANEPSAASADHQQIETMARDLVALHRTVEQLAADHQQLTQEIDKLQMTRELAKRQTEKPQTDKPPAEKPNKRMLRRVSAPPAPLVATMPPQGAPRVATVSRLPPPPQPAPRISSETQSSDPPSLRPPMPVPQP